MATSAAQSPTSPGLPEQSFASFGTTLDSLREVYHVPGMSVAVIRGDSVVYAAGFGYADREAETPATPQTNYRIASLTKPIAAAILLGLQEEGAFSIEDPIKDHVPGYEAFYREVRNYIMAEEPDYVSLVEHFDFERDDLLVRHHLTHTAEFVPGDTFKYNGFLFGTLSRLAEVKLERPFHEIVDARVLAPLGMGTSAASQETAGEEALGLLAKPYAYDSAAARFALADYPEPNVNAGAGIVSNVLDLAKFDAAVDAHALVSPETQAAAWTRQRNNAGEPLPYGLGWFVQERDGAPVVWHYGWQPGAYSGLYLKLPEADFTLFLLANGEGLSAPFAEAGYREDVFASPFAEAFWEAFGE